MTKENQVRNGRLGQALERQKVPLGERCRKGMKDTVWLAMANCNGLGNLTNIPLERIQASVLTPNGRGQENSK
jgi:hypothetical protein